MNLLRELKIFLRDIKFEHTVFALPFAVMSAFIASDGWPAWDKFLLIVSAMVGARSWAMTFNRIVDYKYDIENPRTKSRALPRKLMTKNEMLLFGIVSLLLFLVSAYFLNPLAFKLSPIAILIISFYSYTKRFTSLSHFFLGISLSIAPIGAWVAIREEVSLVSLLLGVVVFFWVSGFDILYSLQDLDFDLNADLYSIPQKMGVKNSLFISKILHILAFVSLISVTYFSSLSYIYLLGVFAASIFLLYENLIVRENDLSNINIVFFNMNGAVSLLLMIFTIFDCLIDVA